MPCPNRATRVVNGMPLCGNHARLVPNGRRETPAVGHEKGDRLVASVSFDRPTFNRVREMAIDAGSAFGAMTRTLVTYALDEIDLSAGRNSIFSDEEGVDKKDGQ
jgi:hypothetical protein